MHKNTGNQYAKKKYPRSESVLIKVTKAERVYIDSLGGPAKAMRSALYKTHKMQRGFAVFVDNNDSVRVFVGSQEVAGPRSIDDLDQWVTEDSKTACAQAGAPWPVGNDDY